MPCAGASSIILSIPRQPLDVLAQQIVAEVAAREYGEDELYALVRRAWPYRDLAARAVRCGRAHACRKASARAAAGRAAYLHRDAVNRRLRARRGARLTAITCGGAIPDNADYQVILEPAGIFVGTLNEDFAVESLAGDVFQLGNSSYRILRVEAGRVRVEDAKGQPPTIPFWLGEAPARTAELSPAVSRLRARVDAMPARRSTAKRSSAASRQRWRATGSAASAARQMVEYLGRREGRARPAADAAAAGVRALLRRVRRHAAGHPRAVRRAHQSRLRPGAAQALLPHLQFRAAGRGDRGCDRAVARARRTASRSRRWCASSTAAPSSRC